MELIINLEVDGAFKTKKIEKDIDGILEQPSPEKDEDELDPRYENRMNNKKINKEGYSLKELKEERSNLRFKRFILSEEEIEEKKKRLDEKINVLEAEKEKKQALKKIDDKRVENKLILFDPGIMYESNLGRGGNLGAKIYIDTRFSMEKMKLPKSVKKITTDIQEIVTNADLFQKVTEYNIKKLGTGNKKNYTYDNVNFLINIFLKKRTKILLNGTVFEIFDNPKNLEYSLINENIYTLVKILVIRESDSTPTNIKKLKQQIKEKDKKTNCQDKRNQINNNSQQLFGIDIFDNKMSDDEEETILDDDNVTLGPLYGKFSTGGRKKKKSKRKKIKSKRNKKGKSKTKKSN